MNFLAQLLSEIQPFEVREIATFSQKIYIFDTNVKISQGRLEISKNELDWLVGLQKKLLKMGLYDSVGQRGAVLEIFQYSDFLTKFQYF